MLKFLLIIILCGYVLMHIGKFFFALGSRSQSRQAYKKTSYQADKKPYDKNNPTQGGEYIDFEEVQ